MIQDKTDLKEYLIEDLKRFDGKKPKLKDWLLKNEWAYIYRYLWILRHLEYHKNNKHKLRYIWYFFWYKRMCFNLSIDIKPNNLGPGFRLMHLGALVRIKKNCKIGRNCTMLPGVVIGNKHLANDDEWVIIGNNCYLGLGVKIFGKVTIGNNVTIGANAVITKDIPDNAIVGGIPARIIKIQ
ncbi:serine O-acetyltransferase [Bacteroides clarus]|uniref:Serine acetyltransferase n=1 Tax=Bacteroides clarus TaxID=626929 RepID=A0A1Y3YPV3_9BACE|nr:serine acetyltransferase [Bacteroides clarus]OUN99903.1 serine acetyltransferase [Bacteroides clarus]